MQEKPITWGLAFSTTWAIFWRAIFVGIVPAIAWNLLARQGSELVQTAAPFIEIGMWFVILVIAVYMVLKRGFGSLKLIFIEQADYQQITSNK